MFGEKAMIITVTRRKSMLRFLTFLLNADGVPSVQASQCQLVAQKYSLIFSLVFCLMWGGSFLMF